MVGDDTMTVIGDSMQVRGNLTGDEDLHVLGRIEGSIDLQRTLIVAESGIVKAEVQVRNAIISGVVVGNVSASESVELTREGRMVGDISAPRVIIVDGASFRGNIDMGDIENMPARTPRERPRPVTVAKPKVEAKKVEAKKAPEPEVEEEDEDLEATVDEATEEAPRKSKVTVRQKSPSPAKAKKKSEAKAKKRPSFLEKPAARGLPKKKAKKSRVVVKRR